jgi:hypothetical protein
MSVGSGLAMARAGNFVYVGEFDFATLGLLDQCPDFRLGLSEPLFVPLFLSYAGFASIPAPLA